MTKALDRFKKRVENFKAMNNYYEITIKFVIV